MDGSDEEINSILKAATRQGREMAEREKEYVQMTKHRAGIGGTINTAGSSNSKTGLGGASLDELLKRSREIQADTKQQLQLQDQNPHLRINASSSSVANNNPPKLIMGPITQPLSFTETRKKSASRDEGSVGGATSPTAAALTPEP